MNMHGKLNYVEFAARDLPATKQFFERVFGWSFTDYGPDYTSFDFQGLVGGFYTAPLASTADSGGALLIFYSERLEESLAAVEAAGGQIIKPIFSFPGGRRFQFLEPSGNELAVWSDR
jgi:uncharacterized protein